MFTTSQKLRLLAYIIILPVLLFAFPILNQMLEGEKKQEASRERTVTPKLESIKIIASRDVVVFNEKGTNIWTPIDRTTILKTNSNFVTLGDNSRLTAKTLDGLLISAGGDTRIDLSKDADGTTLVNPTYGCFGLKSLIKDGTDVGVVFLSGIKKMKIIEGQKTFCRNKTDEEIVEKEADVFLEKETNIAKYPKLKPVYPCRDIIEVDDPSGANASVNLKFIAPMMVSKMLLVSTNPEFTDNVFNGKTFFSDLNTKPLGKGQYFWKIKNESTDEISEGCGFEIVYHGDIPLTLPKNDEVVSDNSIEFSWGAVQTKDKYILVITSDFSKVNHKMEVDKTTTRLDDPLQTLGPGSYYWRVETKDGKISPYRRFFVFTGNDLVVTSPVYGDVFKPTDKFFIINWNPLPMVKNYSIMISSSSSFITSEYANTTTLPFVFIETLKEGGYFLKVSAIFDNNTKITTDVIPFGVYSIPEVEIVDPVSGSNRDVSTDKMMKIVWNAIKNITEYVITVNGEQPIKVPGDRTNTMMQVGEGGNRVQIEAYCGAGLQRKLCAKSKSIEFFVNNVIEPPVIPVIKYPYSRKVFIGGQVSMEWAASKGAEAYKVEISRNKDFAEVTETEIAELRYSVQLGKGIYYWRVSALTQKTGSKIYSKPTETRLFIVK